MNKLIDKIFSISESIRYVSIYADNKLTSKQRADLANSSTSESDKYEELFVNPTILKIVRQRDQLDCGGLNFVIIRYGNFYQLISDYKNGHISICIDKDRNPIDFEPDIHKIIDSGN